MGRLTRVSDSPRELPLIQTITLNTALDRTLEIPGFAVGQVASASLIAEQPAGNGINVSRCLSAYGVDSVLTGFVGSLEVPLYHSSFRDTKAQPMLVPVSGRTRFDTTILDPKEGTETHIREKGFQIVDTDLMKLETVLDRMVDPDDIVAVCGSLPPGITPEQFARLIKQCIDKPARVVVDTSGQALKAAAGMQPYMIKPNVTELQDLVDMELGEPLEIAEAALSLTPGIEVVLVSLGKDGALLVKDGRAWHGVCPLDQEKVVNTVGCGDAMVAGFLAGLGKEQPEPEILALAVAFGTAAALSQTAGTICRDEVDDLLKQATVEEMA